MKIDYINHLGEKLSLSGGSYLANISSLFDYEWKYNKTESNNGRSKLSSFYSELTEFDISIRVHASSPRLFADVMDLFFTTVEKDIENKKQGKLILNDEYYLSCYIVGTKNQDWNGPKKTVIRGVKVVCENPFWCKDLIYKYDPNMESYDPFPVTDSYLDYDYDYLYDYRRGTNVQVIDNNYLDDSGGANFKMKIYGKVIEPKIIIGGVPYMVHTTIYQGETIEIDSKEQTVIKKQINGNIVNLFNSRDKEHSVFEKIKSSSLVVESNCILELTIYQERIEPEWSL